MNILKIADDTAQSRRTKVRLLSTNEIATIIPPGSLEGKVVLSIDKSGKWSRLRPTEVELLEIAKPKKSAPLAIGAQCGLCRDNAATSKCTECGIPICTQECSLANWKKVHRACPLIRP